MKVLTIKESGRGYQILLQNEEVYFLTKEGFYRLGIHEGDEIQDGSRFWEEIEKDRFQLLKHQAMSYLISGPKTKRQIQTKFKKEGYTSSEIDKVIRFLEEYDLLDESEYLQNAVKNLQEKGVSKWKAQCTLKQRGFEEEMTKTQLETWSEETEEKHALMLARKKWESMSKEVKWKNMSKGAGAKKMEKLARFLSSRGFRWDSISIALRAIASEEDQEFYEE